MLGLATVLVVNAVLFTGIAESLLHLLASAEPQVEVLAAHRSILATLAIASNFLCLGLLVWVEGLPSRRLAFVSLANLWVAFGAAPLFLWLPDTVSIRLLWGLLLAGLVGIVLSWMLRLVGRPWLLSSDVPGLRARSGRRVVALAALGFVLLPLLAGSYAVVALLSWGQRVTRGFVSFDLTGVKLGDRRFVKDDYEVRLVGMMHVGERERYRDLVRSFVTENTVVLYEGVTDDAGVLEDGLDYGGAASALGLEAQHHLRDYLDEIDAAGVSEISPTQWPVLRHADLDMSDFSDATRDFVVQTAALWGGVSLLEACADFLVWFRSQDRVKMLGSLQHDLIGRRNTHLIGEMNAALVEFDLVVAPWGALHLPGIERALLESGFSEVARRDRRLLSWTTLLAP